MKILDMIGAALRGKQAPNSAKLAELLAEAETATAAARTRLEELEAQRQDKVVAGDKERQEYRAALNSTRDDVADGEAAIEGLRARHAAAVLDEEQVAQRERYDAALSTAADLPKLIAQYEKHARAIVDTVRRIAEIDRVAWGVNKDLPDGAAYVQTSGALRAPPGQPRQVVGETTVELWCRYGTNEPISAEAQAKVEVDSSGRGYQQIPGGMARYLTKGRFSRQEVQAATTTIAAPGFHELNLPAARGGQAPIFRAPTQLTGIVTPGAVLAIIDESAKQEKLAESASKAPRPVTVEYQYLGEAA